MIRTLGLALIAAFTLAAAPLAAQAAAPASDAKIDLKIDPDSHAAGKKEAPDVVKAAGIPCTVTDAYYIGSSETKDDKGKAVTQKLYEVACQGQVGQILQYAAPNPPKHYDCFAVLSTPNIRCRLPANADLKAVLGTFATAAGKTCTISDFRYVGGTPSGDSYYELGCTGALGFIIKHNGDTSKAIDCTEAVGTNLECKYTTTEALKAADRATIDKLVAASGKTCTIKDTRTIGKLANGGAAFEIACTDAKTGYLLLAKADGSLEHAVPCADAEGILGGCKLTDATVAQTQEAATYTKLVKGAGFNCDVAKYRFIGMDTKTNSEVVELACGNRPDGGIAVLPADNSAGHVLDCVKAGSLGQTCRLTDPSLIYGRYTEALAAKGKGTCKVTNAHWLGRFEQNHTDLIETSCSDGLPGWVMELDAQDHAADLMSCGQAASAGAHCTLPGNTK